MILPDDRDPLWRDQAKCSFPEYKKLDYFTTDPEEKHAIKNICFTECPVREACLQFALESGEIHGIWGGLDDTELRRALSVDLNGIEMRRSRAPQCPYCSARTSNLFVRIVDKPGGGRWATAKVVTCSVCDFQWQSRTSANAVTAYHNGRAAKAERIAKERAAAEQKEKLARTKGKRLRRTNAKPARPGSEISES